MANPYGIVAPMAVMSVPFTHHQIHQSDDYDQMHPDNMWDPHSNASAVMMQPQNQMFMQRPPQTGFLMQGGGPLYGGGPFFVQQTMQHPITVIRQQQQQAPPVSVKHSPPRNQSPRLQMGKLEQEKPREDQQALLSQNTSVIYISSDNEQFPAITPSRCPVCIGRGPGPNGITTDPSDGTVSSKHAEIRFSFDIGFYVKCVSKTNKLWLQQPGEDRDVVVESGAESPALVCGSAIILGKNVR